VAVAGIGTQPDEARMRSLATALCVARAAIGANILLAPRLGSQLLGFPDSQDNATARFGGRLFGVREMALAGYTAAQVQRSVNQPEVYLLNACVDVSDVAVATLTLLGRRGIGRAAFGSALLAVPFAASWLWLRGSCQG
jgi:hypothetical protein